jgi:glycerol-3-phosphate acyltransferase PlsY
MYAVVVLLAAFFAGAVPFSNIAARRRAGVDLRAVGTGTVSGTSLYRVAGFGPLAVVGVAEIAKGMVGPLLAGPDRPVLGAVACGAAVAGHNWSPFLRGAGGRGISPAVGALLVRAWPGAVLLLGALAVGRLLHQTGLVTFLAMCGLAPLLACTHGSSGALAGACVALPMLTKRVVGNGPPAAPGARVYLRRLLYDNDGPEPRAAGLDPIPGTDL